MALLEEALAGRPLSCPVVDAHVHLSGWTLSHCPVEAERMIPYMDRAGVDVMCVNGCIAQDIRAGNDEVARFQADHPGRVVGVGSLNPFSADLVEEARRCLKGLKLRGLKIHSWHASLPHTRAQVRDCPGWEEVWRMAADFGAPILAHGVIRESDVKDFPDTVFIGAHTACSPARLRQFADCPNFYADIAWTQNRADTVDVATSIVGPERILWGTDAPLDDFAQRLGVVLDSGVSDGDKKKILGGNAVRLYGIDWL